MTRFTSLSVLSIAALICAPSDIRASLIFDAAGDFSIANNPNGTWSYGFSSTVSGTFNLYTNNTSSLLGSSNFRAWIPTAAETSFSEHPFVAQNTAATVEQVLGLRLPAGGLGLHPGVDATNEYAIVRWTAPASGTYQVLGAFTDRNFNDNEGATTDVHILLNGASLYAAVINEDGWGLGPATYADTLLLAIGDIIDFRVGRGDNDTFLYDSTGLDAQITFVPEPETIVPEPATSSLWLLGMVGITVGAVRRRKRNVTT